MSGNYANKCKVLKIFCGRISENFSKYFENFSVNLVFLLSCMKLYKSSKTLLRLFEKGKIFSLGLPCCSLKEFSTKSLLQSNVPSSAFWKMSNVWFRHILVLLNVDFTRTTVFKDKNIYKKRVVENIVT